MATLLKVDKVSKHFGGFTALSDVSIAIAQGERFGLIGPNGSGKTTLINCISGTLRNESGSIKFQDSEISRLPAYKRTRRAALDLPDPVAPPREGTGVLALQGMVGLVTLPVRYRMFSGAFFCAIPGEHLTLAGVEAEARGALVIDDASSWRASAMRGVMIQGPAQSFLPGGKLAGADQLVKDAHSQPGEAVLRLLPERAVWWQGWTSGTVSAR